MANEEPTDPRDIIRQPGSGEYDLGDLPLRSEGLQEGGVAGDVERTPDKTIERELSDLSEEDRESVGWGLDTIGLRVEKSKNDIFAGVFGKILERTDAKGTVGRFCKELKDSFVRDSEEAERKVQEIKTGKEKHRLANMGLLVGNVLKYGRLVADATGLSPGSIQRTMMTLGMVTARLSEAGKEARLKSDAMMEKSILEMEEAVGQAWAIYEKAQEDLPEGGEVSTESLNKAYLMNMPENISKRLKIPSAANGFLQRMFRKELEVSIDNISRSINKINNDQKLSPEEKKVKVEKIIKKQERKLRDFDRILTQYGTVDELAMVGYNTQALGKGMVLSMQVQTLYISVDKLWQNLSDALTSSNTAGVLGDAESAPASTADTAAAEGTESARTGEEQASVLAPVVAEATPGSPTEGVVFENGKGGIRGVEELRAQIRSQYGSDLSNAPEGVQKFMQGSTLQKSIELGFFDPTDPSGKESAMIKAGDVLKFDEQGNMLFGRPDAEGNIPRLGEKYTGVMFDSDNSGPLAGQPKEIANDVSSSPDSSQEEVLRQPEPLETSEINTLTNPNITNLEQPAPPLAPLEARPIGATAEPAPGPEIDEARARVMDNMDERMDERRPRSSGQITRVERAAPIPDRPAGYNIEYYNNNYRLQRPYGPGVHIGPGPGISGGGYVQSQDYYGEIPAGQNVTYDSHPWADNNPYGLGRESLVRAYDTYNTEIEHLFPGNTMDRWTSISKLEANYVLGIEDLDEDSNLAPVQAYMRRLHEVTGLKPEGKNIFHWLREEKTGAYIIRALQRAEDMGRLDEVSL